MGITERQERILEHLICDYVDSAEPVGSRTLSKKKDLGVSAATVRNDLSDLEEAGLVMAPHTSAGRIPTDDGLTYYITHLLPVRLAEQHGTDPFGIGQWLTAGKLNDDNMRLALVDWLAKTAGLPAMLYLPALAPEEQAVLARLNLIFLAPGRALLVMVTDDEQVNSELVDMPLSIGEKEMLIIEGLLNHYLRGLPLHYWRAPLAEFLQQQEGDLACFARHVIDRLGEAISHDGRRVVYVSGTLKLLDQPEFRNPDSLRRVLNALEQEETVPNLLASISGSAPVIRLGVELPDDALDDCAMVCTAYHIGRQRGHLGLLGPKRMNYLISARLLQTTVQVLEEAFRDKAMLVPEHQNDLAPLLHSFAWQLRDIRS